jgi:predicted SnoaL-like aldol condensation-catalyzing enzyme
MQSNMVNKSIIRDFYRRAVGQGDIAFAETILADDYLQHSPALKPGKAGVLEALQYLKQMPKPANPSKPFLRLIAEGEYVVANLRFDWGGKSRVVVDLFRLRDGIIAEHWDAVQDQPETTVNGNAMMDGPEEAEDLDLTEQNKRIAGECYQRVFVDKQLDALADYVRPDLIQHIPPIDNGLSGLREYLSRPPDQLSIRKLHRIIGEGNFVAIQSEGQLARKTHVFYTIFRLRGGKIVEHWGIQQPFPETGEQAAGMIS